MTAATIVPTLTRVLGVHRETSDVVTLALAPTGPPCVPGQFNMVWVPGAGEVALSVSGDPADAGAVVHTVRAVGDVTRALGALSPGDVVGVRGPYGRGWPLDALEGRDVLFVAGGIGLAPLRGAILHVLDRRAAFGRVALVVGARTPADLVFAGDLRAWGRRRDVQVLVTVDRAVGRWSGHVGVAPGLLGMADVRPEATAALCCGPEPMMRFAFARLMERGVAPERIFVSLERHMQCGIGVCGHCQVGPLLVCRDGPVFAWTDVADVLAVREA